MKNNATYRGSTAFASWRSRKPTTHKRTYSRLPRRLTFNSRAATADAIIAPTSPEPTPAAEPERQTIAPISPAKGNEAAAGAAQAAETNTAGQPQGEPSQKQATDGCNVQTIDRT